MSRHSSNSKAAGFTLVEMLISAAIALIVLGIAGYALTTSLRTKARETQLVEVQQNVRAAMQLVSQDIRAGAFTRLWNSPACSYGVCSSGDRIAVVTTDGVMTTVAANPGVTFSGVTQTNICDARQFQVGDLAIVSNGSNSQLVEITQVELLANHAQPCSTTGSGNRDRIRHAADSISGIWSTTNYVFRTALATYSLQPDPVDASRQVLYRRTGLSAERAQSGIVAFDIAELRFEYGVPVDPTAAASTLVFYDDLAAAATAMGGGYTVNPRDTTGTYIGEEIRAARVTITGRTPGPLPSTGAPGEFTLTETVEFRR